MFLLLYIEPSSLLGIFFLEKGMDLSRRKFGRHTTETHVVNEREHQPNLISKLIKVYDQFECSISKYLTQTDPNIDFTAIINDYYYSSLVILSMNSPQSAIPPAGMYGGSSRLNNKLFWYILIFRRRNRFCRRRGDQEHDDPHHLSDSVHRKRILL
jgi:hypothetical protein